MSTHIHHQYEIHPINGLALQLTVIAPHCTKLLTECVKTSLQVRCSKACMKDSCCQYEIITKNM